MKKLVNIYKLSIVLFLVFLGSFEIKAQVWGLDKCLSTAESNNKTLQINKNQIEISASKHAEVKGSLLPKVNLVSDYKYFMDLPYQLLPAAVFGGQSGQFKEAQFGVPHNISAQLQFAMPIYQPQIMGGIKATAIAQEMAQLQYQKSTEQVYYEVISLFYTIQLLSQQEVLMNSNLKNTDKLLKNVQLLQTQQMLKGSDVDIIVLQKKQLETQFEVLQNKKNQLLNTLKMLMGLAQNETVALPLDIFLNENIEIFENKNIDNKIVGVQNKLLRSELLTTKTLALPSLLAVGTYGTTGFGYNIQPNQFLKFFPVSFVGLQLNLPIFNGGSNYQKIKQKKLEIKNNELQSQLIADQTEIQIINLNSQLITSQKQIVLTKNQQILGQKIYDQTVMQQSEGMANLTDVLMADNALKEAQQSYFSASIDYLKAKAELKKVTGNFK
jgi:OMF family outer membrane factor